MTSKLWCKLGWHRLVEKVVVGTEGNYIAYHCQCLKCGKKYFEIGKR